MQPRAERNLSPTLSTEDPHPRRLLRIADVVSLVLGIVVGVSIYKVPGDVFALSHKPEIALLIWALGAVLAICGALCYCELAAAFPKFGGEYVYLSQAFGERFGFLFAWMTIFVVLPGNMGAAAYIFADYTAQLHPLFSFSPELVAASAIAFLTSLQLLGFVAGRTTQNLLTLVKIVAFGLLITCMCLLPAAPSIPQEEFKPIEWGSLGLALVFVLYAYGGWNDTAMVTPEVENCRRNMPRALIIGLLLIAGLYLAVNYGFWRVIGYEGATQTAAPAALIMEKALGTSAKQVMSLVIMASALGAMNGMLFSGCRLLAAVGENVPFFGPWSTWNQRQVPVWSLLSLSALSIGMTLLAGVQMTQNWIDAVVTGMGFSPPDWAFYGGGFNLLLAASAPVFWTFFLLSTVALIVLRWSEPELERPFLVPLYPLPAIVFLIASGFMWWSSVEYAGRMTLLLSPLLVMGVILSLSPFIIHRRAAA